MGKSFLHAGAWLLLLIGFWSSGIAQTTIVTDTLLPLGTCPGDPVLVPFSVSGPPLPFGTTYYAEWSGPLGSFDSPDTIGSVPFIFGSTGLIPAQIPNNATLGLYSVRVVTSDNGPITGSPSPLPIPITVVPQLAQVNAQGPDEVCDGESVDLIAGFGIGGSAYAWSNGDSGPTTTVTQTGNYTVTVTDVAGCEIVSDPFPVTVHPIPPQPTVSFVAGQLHSDSAAQQYHWFLNSNPYSSQASPDLLPTQMGYYSLQLEGGGGCRGVASEGFYFVPVVTGPTMEGPFQHPIAQLDTFVHIYPADPSPLPPSEPTPLIHRVFPNPSPDIWHLQATGLAYPEKCFWTLLDAQGKTVLSSPSRVAFGTTDQQIDASGLPNGVYFLRWYVYGRLWEYKLLKTNG